MKKLLLLPLVAIGFSAQAQTYWEEESTGFSTASTGVNEIRYVDANNVWVTGYDGAPGSGLQFRVYAKSTDGGNTWTNGPINLGSTLLGIGSLSPRSATKAWVAAFPDGNALGGVWTTNDGGTVWTKQASASYNTGTDSFTNFVHFFDDNVGVTGGDPAPAGSDFEIYTTTNGGAAWTRVAGANIPDPLPGEFGYTRIYETTPLNGGGDRFWFGTNKGRLLRSDDHGLHWEVFSTPNTDFGDADLGASFAFQDQNVGYMVFKDFSQYKTTDGGATWEATFPEGKIRSGDVCYVGGMPGVMVLIGDDTDDLRGSSYSSDNGATWIDLEEPIDAVSAVEFYDASHGLASGFTASAVEGGIYRWINNFNDILATTVFQTGKAFNVSPNPTNGALNISGKGINTVEVYDLLGKQVSNTKYSTLDAVSIDLGSLNNGIYIVKVSGAEGNASIKVVKQ